MTYHAQCSCGAVQLEVDGEPVVQCYCHCNSCRSLTGSPVNTPVLWPRASVRFTSGEDKLRRYSKSGHPEGGLFSCDECNGLVGAYLPDADLFDIFAGLIPTDRKNDPSDVEGLSFGKAHCAARCGASGKRCNDVQRSNIPHRRLALPELRTSLRPSHGAGHHNDDRASPKIRHSQSDESFFRSVGIISDLDFKSTVHINYENTVLPIRDGLPKLKDMPEAWGGSGDILAE